MISMAGKRLRVLFGRRLLVVIMLWVDLAANNEDVEDEDVVVWVQLGLNHVPRIEDFPVM